MKPFLFQNHVCILFIELGVWSNNYVAKVKSIEWLINDGNKFTSYCLFKIDAKTYEIKKYVYVLTIQNIQTCLNSVLVAFWALSFLVLLWPPKRGWQGNFSFNGIAVVTMRKMRFTVSIYKFLRSHKPKTIMPRHLVFLVRFKLYWKTKFSYWALMLQCLQIIK